VRGLPTSLLLLPLLWAVCLPTGVCSQPETGEGSSPPTVQQTFVQTAYRLHFAPRFAKFAAASAELSNAVALTCREFTPGNVEKARGAWIDAMLAWESAGAILVGPLLDRHSAANVDFWPTRPSMIEGALRKPQDVAALRRTGVAARGLPALEWLLWLPGDAQRTVDQDRACAYTLLLADDVAQEAQILEASFVALGNATSTPENAVKRLGEMINQTTGAVEVLRRKRLLNPASVGNPKAFARSLSGQSRRAWDAQWESINSFLLSGQGSIQALLIESRLDPSAARLKEAATRSDDAIRKAVPADPGSVGHAAEALMKLRRVLEAEVAAPLAIPISFSDFDGD
jgi:uncharacterized protein